MQLTESAIGRLKDLLSEESNPNLKLRVFVQGGGCSGFQYGFTFDEEKTDDDFSQEYETFEVLIDSMSWQYLHGATVDYKDDLMGSSFVIDNPNAQSTCGCGSSFSPH